MSGPRILLVEDDAALREVVAFQLRDAGAEVHEVPHGTDALRVFGPGQFDVVVTDLRMPGPDGLAVLRAVRERDPAVSVLLVTAHASVEAAMTAVRAGAYDFLLKPVSRETLWLKVERAAAQSALLREHQCLRRRLERAGTDGLLIESAPMRELMGRLLRIAPSDLPVLIEGESGTGKELIARALHGASRRATGPFVAVNCAAIPADLLEAELFGHERGAFTGAERAREGRFRAAAGGTLFLDEVGDLPAALQPKLLRALQEMAVEPLGSAKPVPIDVRFVAATHRDLDAAREAGRFRDDLYFRLAGVVLRVPPLRERPADIGPLFAQHFALEAARAGRDLRVGAGVVEALEERRWVGNVRELIFLARQMAVLCEGPDLLPDELPPEGKATQDRRGDLLSIDISREPYGVELPEGAFRLPDVEAALVRAALEAHGGNQSAAARRLGVPRHVLLYRLGKFGIDEG